VLLGTRVAELLARLLTPLAQMESASQVPISPSSSRLRQHLGFSWSAAAFRSSSFLLHPYSSERRPLAAAISVRPSLAAVLSDQSQGAKLRPAAALTLGSSHRSSEKIQGGRGGQVPRV
jgi:hypothetical protein